MLTNPTAAGPSAPSVAHGSGAVAQEHEVRQRSLDAQRQRQATQQKSLDAQHEEQEAREAGLVAREASADRVSSRRLDLDAREVDLDHRQAAQDEREDAQDERDRLREMLIGTLSHDLRNPLGTIVTGAALLMKSGALAEKELKTVARMARGADRMERMIEQLLDFTRIRLGGGLELERTRFNLNELAEAIVDELGLAHADHTIRVTAALDGEGRWDRVRVGEVLSNLVANALQNSPPGGLVTVTLASSEGRVEIEVHNDGRPIAPHLLSNLFDPFKTRRSSRRGLGLGLYITKQIVLAHGGSIDVASSEEGGTTFRVGLPAG